MQLAPLNSDDNPLIRKFESLLKLSHDERQALEKLPMQITVLKDGQDIVREGDSPFRSCLILSGMACSYKATGDGKRQTLAFNLPGDLPDLQSLYLAVMDHSIGTITTCRVGFIPHEALHDLCERHPRIAKAFWRETLVSAAVYREWLLNVGQRDALSRMAHVFCELVMRLRAVGLVEGHDASLPITQTELADTLGITTVHANRVLRQMRAEGLIALKGDRLHIPDWERLRQVADFDPTYLHMKQDTALS
jgi:CRP-like cAMP-binding protein